MDSRQPELSRLTLMCSDHEVAEFTWNHDRQAVTGKTHVLDAAHAPLMATDPSGNITRDRLSSWFKNRGIPDFRPDAADRLRAVGYPSAAQLEIERSRNAELMEALAAERDRAARAEAEAKAQLAEANARVAELAGKLASLAERQQAIAATPWWRRGRMAMKLLGPGRQE